MQEKAHEHKSLKELVRSWLAEEAMGAYAMVVGAYAVVYLTSYVYAVVIARLLGPSSYSALASLLAFGTIIAVGIGGPLQSIIARYVAADTALGLEHRARYLVRKVLVVVACASAVVLVLTCALSWPIKEWLNIATLPPVLLLALFTSLWLIHPVMSGTAQGNQRFKLLSIAFVAAAVTRIVIGIVLVALGLGVSGAMIAEVASGVVVLALLGVSVKRWLGQGPAYGEIDVTHLKRFATTVIVSSTCLAAFIYLDVFLVRGLIGGVQAGYYAAAQKLGTVIYFIPGIMAVVLFPRVSANHANEISSWRALARVEGVVLVLCGSIAAFLALAPEWSMRLVFGSKYVGGSGLVPIFALAMFFFSLLPVPVQFLQATDRHRFIYVLILGVVAETVAILLFHETITQVAWIVAAVACGMVVMMGVYTFADWSAYRRKGLRDSAGVSSSTA